mgnify:CR=1 FL=1
MTELKFGPSAIGVMLPGQASQEKGMGVEAWEVNAEAKRIFAIGSEVAGIDLLQYCAETETKDMAEPYIQPALGASHLSALAVARSKGLKENLVIGAYTFEHNKRTHIRIVRV